MLGFCRCLPVVILVLSLPVCAHAESVTPDVWTAYMASQDRAVEWAGTVRGVGRRIVGLAPDDPEYSPQAFQTLESTMRSDARRHDLIVPLGWIESGKNPEQVQRLFGEFQRRGADTWKRALTEQVARLERSFKGGRIYWQIGNEINSRFMTRAAKGAGRPDDPSVLPFYAEYIFAPTVEALRAASRELYGDPKRIKVMLGTIANARRESSRDWLDQLLKYRIKGDFAPTLANSRVAEHISIISLHYVVSRDDPPWEGIFDTLDRTWRKPGGIEGIWATEELGDKRAEAGLGAAVATRVAASYLSRASELQLPSTALRASLYGWRMGPSGSTGADGMQLLLDWFGSARLVNLSDRLALGGSGPLKAYAYAPLGREGHYMVIAFARGGQTGRLSQITLRGGVSEQGGVEAVLLGSRGSQAVDVTVRASGEGRIYQLGGGVDIGENETLILRQGSKASP